MDHVSEKDMSRRLRSFVLPVVLVVAGWAPSAHAQGAGRAAINDSEAVSGPVFSDNGPHAADYGAAEHFPIGPRETFDQVVGNFVGAYSHFDQIFPSRLVPRASRSWDFKRAREPKIFYNFESGRFSIENYLSRNPTTGLLIAKDDTILYEHYQYGRTDRDRFLSQSMAKTITAMLIGVAISEGKIKSIKDLVSDYVPGLASTLYGKTRIRDLLHMASGVTFLEDYGGRDDLDRLNGDLFGTPSKDPVASVAQFNTRRDPLEARWKYASIETEVLGLVLRAAIGRPVADYLHDKIWQAIGAEADASWAIDGTGHEVTYCCFNAVLRDYARLGRLLAHDGAWEGRQLIPRKWLLDATTVRPADCYLARVDDERYFGYGYQVWIFPDKQRRFALMGIRGQLIFVDPASKLVMVHTAVRKDPSASEAEAIALWRGVLSRFLSPKDVGAWRG